MLTLISISLQGYSSLLADCQSSHSPFTGTFCVCIHMVSSEAMTFSLERFNGWKGFILPKQNNISMIF